MSKTKRNFYTTTPDYAGITTEQIVYGIQTYEHQINHLMTKAGAWTDQDKNRLETAKTKVAEMRQELSKRASQENKQGRLF